MSQNTRELFEKLDFLDDIKINKALEAAVEMLEKSCPYPLEVQPQGLMFFIPHSKERIPEQELPKEATGIITLITALTALKTLRSLDAAGLVVRDDILLALHKTLIQTPGIFAR